MATSERHGLKKYNNGCRCDQCKQAKSEYQRARRQRLAEAVGTVDEPAAAALRLLTGSQDKSLTSANADEAGSSAQQTAANSVYSAVSAEIEGLGGTPRPGLVATALALARILDNPKAVSTQPAAAAKLSDLLTQLHKGADSRKSRLAAVRAMTSTKSAAG